MGCSFIAPVQEALGGVADVALTVASVVPGPWQVPALIANTVHQAEQGNPIGALASAVGAYGAGGGFSTGGFDSSTITNPGGIFTPVASPAVADLSNPFGTGMLGADQLPSITGTGGIGAVTATAPSGLWETAKGLIGKGEGGYGNLISTGLNLGGSYLSGRAAQGAAQTSAEAQIRAAQIAADAAKFRPVGVTTNFGKSQFNYDRNGNLVSAGYALDPRIQAQQNQLMAAAPGMLNQFTGSQAATAPMGQAAQSAMSLGNQYLTTSPQAQAAKYLAEQQGLLAPQRATDLAQLQAQMQAQGRGGFAIGGGVNGQGAANPQLQALYNARMQQDAQLAANATQGGMDYAKFGLGMAGSGGDLMRSMYDTQRSSYSPYQTAMGGAQMLEGLGQNALDSGMAMGSATTAANAAGGRLLGQGMTNAAQTMQPANAYSPWGGLLSGAGQAMQNYRFDPMTGRAL